MGHALYNGSAYQYLHTQASQNHLYINNSVVWNAGNDGAGSGLDADLLDGIDSTGFMKQLSDSSSPNYTTPSSRRVDPNATNPTNAHHAIVTFGNDGNVTGQLATHFQTGQPYTRGFNNSWSAWQTIWTNVNDGSGSTLDADTVDGLHASNFARGDTTWTSGAGWRQIFHSGSGGASFPASHYSMGVDYANGAWSYPNYSDLIIGYHTGIRIGGGYSGIRFYNNSPTTDANNDGNGDGGEALLMTIGGGGSATSGAHVYIENSLYIKNGGSTNNVAWNAGNDGSGSGLDADLLDGMQPGTGNSNIAYTGATGNLVLNNPEAYSGEVRLGAAWDRGGVYASNTLTLGTSSSTIHMVFNNSVKHTFSSDGRISGTYFDYGNASYKLHAGDWGFRHSTPSGWIQFGPANTSYAHIYTDRNSFYFNVTTLSANGNLMWHAGNDGSGSGLDADLLDGIQGSSYLRSDTSDTFGGLLTVSRNGTTGTPSYTNGQIEVITSSNHVPAIGFHRGGYSATTLYESNGELYVNPWVTRAQAGLLLSSGNISSYAWTSSNDGSGSGLDADTVDGAHASSFTKTYDDLRDHQYMHLNHAASGTDPENTDEAWFLSNHSNSPNSSYYWHIQQWFWASKTTSSNRAQLAIQYNGGNNVYSRSRYSSWGSWAKLWSSANDGSGSGLDADTCDGQHLGTGNSPTFSSVYTSNWFRSTGATGWYNQSYTGGIYMEDTTWVRTYNNKNFYVGGGEIATTGNVTAYYSDERLKDKTGDIENALSKVLSLEGFTYVENDLARELGYTNTKEQVGLSAQRVQAVLPQAVSLAPVDYKTLEDGEIVSKSGENYLTVDYSRLVPLLVESIKELKAEVDDLKAQLKEK